MADVLVVGAGVVGASVAFHLAERGVDTLIVDREGPAAGPTARSGSLIRCHYPTALEGDLAWESLTEYFESWGERIGGGCGFTRTGFAHVSGEDNAQALAANVAMLKKEVGVETEEISPARLRDIDPSINTEGLSAVAYEPRGGYADPVATTVSLLQAAERHGARFERRRVTEIIEHRDRVSGVQTEAGPLDAETVVLAAGIWSVPLAEGLGLKLPVQPAQVWVALMKRPYSLPHHLAVLDSTINVYFRPAAEHCTLFGKRRSELEWLESPDECQSEVRLDIVEEACERVGRRVPALADCPYLTNRAGVLDMTPDGRPILGPAGPEGLHLATGWSGTGFKKAPAVGAEIARWIIEGSPKRPELIDYRLSRVEEGDLVQGAHEYDAKTPH